MNSVLNMDIVYSVTILILAAFTNGQRDSSSSNFQQIMRVISPVPKGRVHNLCDVRMLLYGAKSSDPSVYSFSNITRLLNDPNFDPGKPSTIYVHGYVELTSDDSVLTVIDAYLRHGGYNVLALDWSNLAFGDYVSDVRNVQKVGLKTGSAIWRLSKKGLALDTLHIVGHSLGAHLGAAIARYVKMRGYPLSRLTGLDPAYPGFYPPVADEPIGPDDAVFVDIVHTDAGGYGTPDRGGDVDFWPNSGYPKQPGCTMRTLVFTSDDFCSHWRSWQFWSEAVSGGQFLAQQCRDYQTFLQKRCGSTPVISMGLNTNTTARGNFYLRTAAQSPFALGERGI